MKVTIIYDNTAFRAGLRADWGFAALVETGKHRILFDTGADGRILLSNMKKLGIDPLCIEEVFISHLHFDHVGGLGEFLKVNRGVKRVYLPSSLGLENEVVLKEPKLIHEAIFSTGELGGIEQSMGIITKKGVVLIVGCSHPPMEAILATARKFGKVYAIIGGLHGFSKFELFKDLSLICPTHCTQFKSELRALYPEKYVEGGVGRVIEI